MFINQWFNRYHKDYYGGGLMIVIGLGAVACGADYQIGSLRQMGPGFFPVAVGVLLAMIGGAIGLQASLSAPVDKKVARTAEWRGWLCIVSALIAFVIIGAHGGLLPATFAVVFISALGDRKNRLKDALVLALALVVVSVLVFWWALKVQFPLFQWGW